MEPRKIFHKREYRFPRTSFTLSGYSRAAYRSGFYINGLGIALDGGPQVFKRASHYLITHAHTDHTACLPYSLIGDSEVETATGKVDRPIVYCPAKVANVLDQNILTSFRSNFGTDRMDTRIREFYEVRGLDAGEEIHIVANKQKLTIHTFKSDHSVPTLVYGISMEKKKLKPEFEGLTKTELGNLARSGTQLSGPVNEPLLSYVLDSSIHTLESHPEVLDYPTVIIECTFLLDGEEEAAEDKKHIHWNDLVPYIESRPDTTFILTHFSLKYTDEEIQNFFREQISERNLTNIVPWLTDIEFELEDHGANEEVIEEYDNSVMSLTAKSDVMGGFRQVMVFYLMVCIVLFEVYRFIF